MCKPNTAPLGAIRWKWISDLENGTGIKWDNDILRHAAASYLVARHEDVGRCARWLGNSADILLHFYHELVDKKDSDQFWTVSTLNKAKFVMRHVDPDILRLVHSGWLCVSDAFDECALKLGSPEIKAA